MLRGDLAYIKMALKDIFVYRFAVAAWVLITPVTLAVYYFLWTSIYAHTGQSVISGYTFNELMSYFVLVQLSWLFIWSDVDQRLSNHVQQGMLETILIRPVTIMKALLLGNVGEIIFVTVIQAVPLLAIGAIFFGLRLASATSLSLSIISAVLAITLNLFFVFFLGLSSFWLTRYSGIRQIKNGLTLFLSGGIVPLSFFPEFWQKVFSFLPFQYMFYAPIQIYLGKYVGSAALSVIGIQVVWVVLFYALIRIAWPRAMAHFSAVGG